jgi:Cys-rich protein (TIGR01571 family)
MATFQTHATDKNGKVLLGKLRSVSTQDGFDTALCTSALGLACLGGGGCDVCCTAIFCPCFLFGSNVKILRSGSYQSPCVDVTGCKRSAPCVKFLVPYTCIAMAGYTFLPIGPLAFCPLAMYTASYRHLIRKEFGITSSGQCVPGFSNDICVHFFCFPFALCQEHAELRSHLPFTPLKTMYTNTGESLGVADKKKPEKFKWSFNLDDVSDDDDDAGEVAKRRAERLAAVSMNAPRAQGMSGGGANKGDAKKETPPPHDYETGPKRVHKQDDSVYVDGRCNLCSAGPFHNLDKFSDHMVEHTNLRKIHEAIRNKTGTVTCNACAQNFNNVPALGQHVCRNKK